MTINKTLYVVRDHDAQSQPDDWGLTKDEAVAELLKGEDGSIEETDAGAWRLAWGRRVEGYSSIVFETEAEAADWVIERIWGGRVAVETNDEPLWAPKTDKVFGLYCYNILNNDGRFAGVDDPDGFVVYPSRMDALVRLAQFEVDCGMPVRSEVEAIAEAADELRGLGADDDGSIGAAVAALFSEVEGR